MANFSVDVDDKPCAPFSVLREGERERERGEREREKDTQITDDQ